jgi:hypothetical protein
MYDAASAFDVLHAVPVAGAGGLGVGWWVGRLSWLSSACERLVNLRRRLARQVRLQTPETMENDQDDPDGVDARLAAFVATENIKRYKEMLDSQPGEADGQVITRLLVEEEARVQRLLGSSIHRSARGRGESRAQHSLDSNHSASTQSDP